MDPTDVGKWNVTENDQMLLDLNREFSTYDTAEFWSGLLDIGTSALFTSDFGGGFGKEGFDPFKWGGEDGKTTGEMIQGWFSKPGTDYVGTMDAKNIFK